MYMHGDWFCMIIILYSKLCKNFFHSIVYITLHWYYMVAHLFINWSLRICLHTFMDVPTPANTTTHACRHLLWLRLSGAVFAVDRGQSDHRSAANLSARVEVPTLIPTPPLLYRKPIYTTCVICVIHNTYLQCYLNILMLFLSCPPSRVFRYARTNTKQQQLVSVWRPRDQLPLRVTKIIYYII